MIKEVGPIRHAPWSKWFKTFYCNGNYAHELQVGPVVLQLFHHKFPGAKLAGRLNWFKDRYWRI